MNLEDTIYYGCAAWASIFYNRAAALNYLFCTSGNGYEWQNGELVEHCGNTTTSTGRRLSLRGAINKVFQERRGQREEANTDFKSQLDASHARIFAELKKVDPALAAKFRAQNKAEFKQAQKELQEERRLDYRIPTDVAKRIQDTTFDDWYPMSKGSAPMCRFPADIQPDWLEGIIQTGRLIIGTRDRLGEYPRTREGKDFKRTVQVACDVLSEALALKAKRQRTKKRRKV